MPTVMVTFDKATYVLGTFVHISNISTVTDPILTKYFDTILGGLNFCRPHSFWTKLFWTKEFFIPKSFWPKFFLTRFFLTYPLFFWLTIFTLILFILNFLNLSFLTKFFGFIFFNPIFFGPMIFWTQSFYLEFFCRTPVLVQVLTLSSRGPELTIQGGQYLSPFKSD